MILDKLSKHKYNYLLLLGHVGTDINQGALPALMPFLIQEYSLSYAKAAGLIFACNLISSIVQPLFGHLGDKMHKPQLLYLALFLSGAGISLMGFVHSYLALFISAMISGVGVALFHPEGSKLANMVSTGEKATGVGIFSVGGNIGFALGPIIVVVALAIFGMKGLIAFVLITILTSLLLFLNMKGLIAKTKLYHETSKKKRLRVMQKKIV
ncbi:MAG: MFS transporter [Clostridiales Family XIII bacterium]|jgi:FSR family fosmidomycin resistance protein-like MFS transporter|nr:MFS transporter [Clostridiales Family XIII bacterium]